MSQQMSLERMVAGYQDLIEEIYSSKCAAAPSAAGATPVKRVTV